MRSGGTGKELADSWPPLSALPGRRPDASGRGRAAGAGAARTRPQRASQHRPARRSHSSLWFRRRPVCRRHRDPAGAQRGRAAARLEAWSRDEIANLRDELDRANALLLSEPQVVVDWPAGSDEPTIDGDPGIFGVAASHRVLAFGSWLDPGKAAAMEHAVDALRARGEAFAMTLTTLSGHPIEAQGRAIGGRAVLRLKDASGIKRELVELVARYERLSTEAASLRALVEALPSPVWTRDAAGQLTFVNAAYARAVEAKSAADAVEREPGAARQPPRATISRRRAPVAALMPAGLRAVVAGARRTFDVLDFRTEDRQRRHRHRRHRSGNDARRARPARRCASPHARSAFDRRRHVRRRSPADLLQCRLSRVVGARCRPSSIRDRPIPR